jgi:hypothetical protein
LKPDQKSKKYVNDDVPVKAMVKKNGKIREAISINIHEYDPEYAVEVEQVLEGKNPKKGSNHGR